MPAKTLRFPVNAIAQDLRAIHAEFRRPTRAQVVSEDRDEDSFLTDETIDVRLQIFPDGSWKVHHGDAGWDTDHHGAWASDSIDLTTRLSYNDACLLARVLINQAADMAAEDPTFAHPIAYALTRKEKATMYQTAVQRLIHGDLLAR